MRSTQALVLSLMTFLASQPSLAGAVSAGGMLAPAKVECLFVDPAKPMEPYNLMIFDYGSAQNPASLVKVDLVTKDAKFHVHYKDLIESQRESTPLALIYRGADDQTGTKLRVTIDEAVALDYSKYIEPLKAYVGIKDVVFDQEAIGYRASMNRAGQRFDGICAKGYFFFYSKDGLL